VCGVHASSVDPDRDGSLLHRRHSNSSCRVRILVHPQPSMRSYEDGKWLISKDSQINRLLDWVEALPDDWDWLFLMPMHYQSDENSRMRDMIDSDRIAVAYLHWPSNVLLARYDFHAASIAGWIGAFKPDLILNEVPELARNYKTTIKMLGMDIPVASLCIHLADPDMDPLIDYTSRQWDGYYSSDLFAFQLEGTRQKFFGSDEPTKTPIWNALYSPVEIE